MSAFGGKADIANLARDVRLWPKTDMSGLGLLPCKRTPETPFRLSQIPAVITSLQAIVSRTRDSWGRQCDDVTSSHSLVV
jgi:hypothetical protein